MPKETNPKLVFERLFGSGKDADRGQARRPPQERARFRPRGCRRPDRQGRPVRPPQARRIFHRRPRHRDCASSAPANCPEPKVPAGVTAPGGIPTDYQEHIRLMADLMVLAFQADVTRVCTFVLANEGSNKPYPFINIRDGHHELSHHGGDAKKKEKIREINTLPHHATRLPAGKAQGDEGGRRHAARPLHDRLRQRQLRRQPPQPRRPARPPRRPRLRHHQDRAATSACPSDTPLNNLWLSMLDRMEVKMDGLGDSTGRIAALAG